MDINGTIADRSRGRTEIGEKTDMRVGIATDHGGLVLQELDSKILVSERTEITWSFGIAEVGPPGQWRVAGCDVMIVVLKVDPE